MDRKFGKGGIASPRLKERPRYGKLNVTYTPQREATSLAVLPGGGIAVAAAGSRDRPLTNHDFALAKFKAGKKCR